METWHLAVQVAVLFVSLSMFGVAIIKIASNGRKELLATITTQHAALLAEVRRVDDEQDSIRSQTGEAIASIRHDVSQLGFYIRDNYVRELTFNSAVASIKDTVTISSAKLEASDLVIRSEITKVEAEVRKVEAELRRQNSEHK